MSDQQPAGVEKDPIIFVRAYSPGNPEDLKVAFSGLIEGVIKIGEDMILDWDTMAMTTRRFLNEETGQGIIQMNMAVRAMRGGADE